MDLFCGILCDWAVKHMDESFSSDADKKMFMKARSKAGNPLVSSSLKMRVSNHLQIMEDGDHKIGHRARVKPHWVNEVGHVSSQSEYIPQEEGPSCKFV